MLSVCPEMFLVIIMSLNTHFLSRLLKLFFVCETHSVSYLFFLDFPSGLLNFVCRPGWAPAPRCLGKQQLDAAGRVILVV